MLCTQTAAAAAQGAGGAPSQGGVPELRGHGTLGHGWVAMVGLGCWLGPRGLFQAKALCDSVKSWLAHHSPVQRLVAFVG